jgi:hypothetical protein
MAAGLIVVDAFATVLPPASAGEESVATIAAPQRREVIFFIMCFLFRPRIRS